MPKEKKNCYHSFHIFPLQINFDKLKINKKELFKRFKKRGINLQVHYIPIHLQPFYKKKFLLPIYPDLKNNDLYKVINELLNIK